MNFYDTLLAEKLSGGGGGGDTFAKVIDRSVSGSVTIPNGVTQIGAYAFYKCNAITDIVFPNSVTIIEQSAFQYCSKLERLNLPEGVQSLSNNSFNSCSAMEDVVLPSTITSLNGAFRGCKIKNMTVKAINPPSCNQIDFSTSYNIYVPAESVDAYKGATYWSNFASHIQAIPE